MKKKINLQVNYIFVIFNNNINFNYQYRKLKNQKYEWNSRGILESPKWKNVSA